jgi:hypothetical protein
MPGTAPVGVTRNDTYVANMAALWRHDPTLAMEVDALAPDDVAVTHASRAGPPTAVAFTPDGRNVHLHSRYDPNAEAAKFVAGLDFGDAHCVIVSGFGLGYHVDAIRGQLADDAVLVVIEPSLPMLKAALMSRDLTALLKHRRLVFLTSADTTTMHRRLERHAPIMLLGSKFVSHPASQQVSPDAYTAIRGAVTDFISYSRMTLVTLVAISRATNQNIAANLPTYVATPTIDNLLGRFKGVPAIVISAGPSLAKNMDQLADARGRAVLVAVQTVFKPLLDRGIVPDFVTSLDYNEVSMRFFEGIDDFHDVQLIAEPKAHARVIDRYGGPISLLDNTFARLCLGDALGGRAGLKAGATVAHLAFYLACELGCDPVIFVGQDLAYSDHLFYTPGVPHHREWRPEMNRFYTIETKEWERILRRRPVLRRVRDVHGNEIFTDETLFTYLQQFESDFGEAGGRTIIDASEGGAQKRGAVSMTLADALSRYANRPMPEAAKSLLHRPRQFDATRLAPSRAAVAERLEQVQRIGTASRETLEILDQLVEWVREPDRFNRLVMKLDEKRAFVRRHDRIYGMISGMCQLAELRKLQADLQIRQAGGSEADRTKRQLRRDIEFVTEFIEAADDLAQTLQHALDRFDAAIAAHAGASGGPV